MFTSDKPYTLDSVVRLLLGVGFFLGLIWLLGFLSNVLIPFVVALLVAYLLNPLTCFIQKYVKSRGIAVAVTLIGLVAFIVGVFMVIVPMMATELTHMGRVLSELVNNAEFATKVSKHLPPDVWQWLRNIASQQEVRDLFSSTGAADAAQSFLDTIIPGVKGLAQGTASFLAGFLGLGIIILYLVFLLADFGKIKENWQEYLPAGIRDSVTGFLGEFEKTMSLYFRGQISIALIVGVLMSIGFTLIDLPLGIVLGMIIGILNIAPYLGAVGMVPAVLLAALDSLEAGESVWIGVGLVVAVMAIVQTIQEVFLVPKIQGESLGLSPWLILLSLSVWGKLLGFLGLLIALPMTCLCLSYYRRMLAQTATAE
ncbi:AI-2E family transporter [Pseudodesulfovibrio sediminis]|uniref:AI-2E family transporter n=1 Tax=Pseudodesulfovibrio sediminis TaxID=2810563 RepID=A0ABM7P6M6_9BACT|nr:AI-2E family transporter [Pseudodesulfovibrio sediminis]BCS88601.1 AI-2E family transporter [Pseudodesulfovibrio sediminis]